MPSLFSDAFSRPLLLDGALGTELAQRGVDVSGPLWSSAALISAPQVLRALHAEYLDAGSDIVTTASFRLDPLSVARVGENLEDLVIQSVQLAFEARDRYRWPRPVAVAGNIGPIGDCYRPEEVPNERDLPALHEPRIRALAGAGVDLLFGETLGSVLELRVVARLCRDVGLPFALSMILRRDGCLLSGEPLSDAVAALLPFHPSALLVNCAPAGTLLASMLDLRELAPDLPFGACGNVGDPLVSASSPTMVEEWDLPAYTAHALSWIEAGATLVGGCCGTGPAHIRALAEALARPCLIPEPYVDPRRRPSPPLPSVEEFYDL